MKRLVFFLAATAALLPALCFSARAQPFPSGNERLDYVIRHSFFPGEIGTMSFRGTDRGDTYAVEATLDAAVGNIYALDCRYGSTFRKDAVLTPVAASRSQTEKKYWAKGNYTWSAPGKVQMDVTKSTRPPRNETLLWSGTVRDLLGTIWWLRSLDYGQAGIQAGNNALLLDHDAIPVTITSYGKKTIRHKGKETPVIEIVLSQNEKEALRLTLTDDPHRSPLRFSLSLPFGTIKGTLK